MHKNKIKIVMIGINEIFRGDSETSFNFKEEFISVEQRECENGINSVIETYQPNLLLMNINMPYFDVIEATKFLNRVYPDVRVVVLSIYEDEINLLRALNAGAVGYLLKEMSSNEKINAIRLIYQKGGYIHPKVTCHLVKAYRLLKKMKEEIVTESQTIIDNNNGSPVQILTNREFEILQLLAEGFSNRSISKKLYISEKTVKNHVSSILRKMSVADRTGAVIESIRRGWVKIQPIET
ncbi:LuxR C-terminal-related transcriptional regulator (plasmid) [Exiguobacterium acetylicum]